MPGRGLNLLSLDGGGIRGLSSLQILKRLMEGVARERDWDEPPKPCEFFDMIGGTSTGGLIAIMLGRLEMSIDDCINAYIELSSNVFSKKHLLPVSLKGKVQARFDSEELKKSVKTILNQYGFKEDELLKNFGGMKCKIFVCATSADIAKPILLTSYRSVRSDSDRLNHVKIWQAARATSAASTFFEPIAIPLGSYTETFVDGATGANNPVQQVWNEAADVWMTEDERLEDNIDCFISIGTGVPSIEPFGESLKGLAHTLVKLSTETEDTAEIFQRAHLSLSNSGRYCRLNVMNGLQNIGLEEAEKRDFIMSTTKHYLESQDVLNLMNKSVKRLAEHEYLHRAPIRRDRWSLAVPDGYRMIYPLLEAISAYDHVTTHRVLNESRLPGTGEWFLKHSAFEAWLDGRESTVFYCSGIVGSGKTMIATAVVETLNDQAKMEGKPVLYYYYDFQQRAYLTASALARSFIKQLLIHNGLASHNVAAQFRAKLEQTFSKNTVPPSDTELFGICLELIQQSEATILVIDGLHEIAEEEVSKALDFIGRLQQTCSNGSSKAVIFARDNLGHNIDIRRRLQNVSTLQLSLSLVASDISTFVENGVDYRMRHERPITQNESLLVEMKEILKNEGEKMFLWIHLQLISIWRCCATDNDIIEILKHLPDGLDETYTRCLEQIDRQPIHKQYAPRIFKWIAFAQRPLRDQEMREAITIQLTDLRWNRGKTVNLAIPECCANLVEVNAGNNCLRFVHPSVRQYLEYRVPSQLVEYALEPDKDHLRCGELCVTYLSMEDFGLQLQERHTTSTRIQGINIQDAAQKALSGVSPKLAPAWRLFAPKPREKDIPIVFRDHRQKHDRFSSSANHYLETYRFLRYARKNWPSHTRNISEQSTKWECFKLLALNINESLNFQPWWNAEKKRNTYVPHMFAYAIETDHLPLYTLAIEAVGGGRRANGILNGCIPDSDFRPLHLAAALGRSRLLVELLKHCPVNTTDSGGNTALHFAVTQGHESTVKDLCEKHADQFQSNQDSNTPLMTASQMGNFQLVNIMLESVSPALSRSTSHREFQTKALNQAALAAVGAGHVDILELLLSKGANKDAKVKGQSLVQWAIQNGHGSVFRFLVSTGADTEDDKLSSLEQQALAAGRTELLQMPWRDPSTAYPVRDPSVIDADGQNLIHRAANAGHAHLIEFLVAKGVDINGHDRVGETALHNAVRYGRDEMIKYLVDAGADIRSRYFGGSTALHIAARNGNVASAKVLLAASRDPSVYINDPDRVGWTPLHDAVDGGKDEMIKYLLDAGADIRSRNSGGSTALHIAARNGRVASAKVLLEASRELFVDINDPGGLHWAPLHEAVRGGSCEMVKYLLDAGADIQFADNDGETALHLAATFGKEECMQLLLAAGADPSTASSTGHTAAETAFEERYSTAGKVPKDASRSRLRLPRLRTVSNAASLRTDG